MGIQLQQMSLGEYAALQARLGVKIIKQKGRYWRQVRPFFYRPLLPVEAYDMSESTSPVSWPSGYQYVVPSGKPANSTMNFIMLHDLQNYSLNNLNHKRRHVIKSAAQQFQVRRVTDPREIWDSGHKVYMSFYQRTRYPYKSDRQNKAVFGEWIDSIFSNPKAIMLGGYGPEGLGALSTFYWINDTLIWSTMICETEAMKKKLGELMFHEFRLLAAQHSAVKEIFVRNYQGGNSLDHYYLLRGCQLIRKPAQLEMPPLIQALIRWGMPKKHQILRGDD